VARAPHPGEILGAPRVAVTCGCFGVVEFPFLRFTSCRILFFALIYTPQAMPIPENIGAGPAGQNRERVRIPKQEELRAFWERVTEGLELQQLWSQFSAEAKESYGLYSREVDWKHIQEQKRWQQPFHAAWALFQAMLMKLSPARRVLLLAAVFFVLFSTPALLVYSFDKSSRPSPLEVQFFGAGAALLFILLALELADRVTMKRDLEIAREIQRWLVPVKPPEVPGVDIAFATRPANTVAGDYYDAFLRPDGGGGNRLLLVVADVAGKSVPAALLMATFQASLQTLAITPSPLPELVAGLNRYACAHSLNGLRFTTAFLAELDLSTRVLTYINAGHNAPVVLRASGRIERLEAGGLPLGISIDSSGPAPYESASIATAPGDLLVIFTDGLVEAIDTEGEEYGESKLFDVLKTRPPFANAAETLKRMMSDVDQFVGSARQHDDVTCLVLRVVAIPE
jgi:sigma-B regulation protein RsbU (phosphoserine phosphatase)